MAIDKEGKEEQASIAKAKAPRGKRKLSAEELQAQEIESFAEQSESDHLKLGAQPWKAFYYQIHKRVREGD
ncbi:hypothetical protein [Paenibacillus sp. KN14-4R]|uniref:hypothetical protein n=1 Tax=Paenibacillus sp. KN14-4R TaxID=3445773 RepID=UPI003FA07637